ncbi:MAG TPA: NAD-dependent epimerase/dehydratase family protein [Actinomycetes bacterium]
MRTVVTGGAGFIGSHLVDRLLGEGHHVVVVDDLSTGTTANLAAALDSPALTFVEGDVAAPAVRDEMAAAGAEVIFHLAAQMDVRHSVADPIDDARRNVLGTVSVLEAARLGRTRKVVFASSGGSIYGDQERLPVDETARTDPHAPYAASKICGEVYLGVYRHLHGTQTTALALGNVYGPRQDPRGEAGVVAIFASAMLEGRSTVIFGSGCATRDYVYVDDVVDAFARAAGPAGDGLRLNIGTGIETSVRRLHTLVAAAVGCHDRPRLAPERPGELDRVALDATAAGQVLGWRPQVGIDEGLRRTVAWLSDDLAVTGPLHQRR